MNKEDLELYQKELAAAKERLNNYSKRIKELREKMQMSQEEFANKCGHTSDNARSWTSKLETGRIKLSLDDAFIVADALKVPVNDLLYPERMISPSTINLTDDESKVIDNYRKLSINGKNKVLERIDELMQLEGVKT